MYYVALAVVLLIFIWRITGGFKKGMVKEIISLIAMVVAGFCMMLILSAVNSYLEQEMGKLIQMIIVLFVVCLVYRLVNVLFTSLKLISKLPVVKGVDKLLGAVIGCGEAALIVGLLVYLFKTWGLAILS